MIAKCKFCHLIVTPVAVLPIRPAQLAKLPPEQLEIMRFSAGVTEHVRKYHPEFLLTVQQLAGSFIGHCTLSIVDPLGRNHRQFRAMCAADDNQLRAMWEAMPNPPHPDAVAAILSESRALLETALELDAQDAGGGDAITTAHSPGPILLT